MSHPRVLSDQETPDSSACCKGGQTSNNLDHFVALTIYCSLSGRNKVNYQNACYLNKKFNIVKEDNHLRIGTKLRNKVKRERKYLYVYFFNDENAVGTLTRALYLGYYNIFDISRCKSAVMCLNTSDKA